MESLFAIALLSFCALLWAALSIARHVRANSRVGDFSGAAAEDTSRLGVAGGLGAAGGHFSVPQTTQKAREASNPGHPDDIPAHGLKRPTRGQASRTADRSDWAYFQKDFGDLNDPPGSPRLRGQVVRTTKHR